MDTQVHGILINNVIHSIDMLPDYCTNVLSDRETPEWQKEVFGFILEWISDSTHIVQRTSGTSGKPKELRLSKKSMMLSARNTCEYFDLRFGQTALLCLPMEYIAGKMMVVRAFVGGLNLILTKPTSMPDITGFETIHFCAMVPLQVYNSLNSIETLRRIQKLIIGGAEIRDELEVMLLDLPNMVYATYGMAETCSHVAIRRLSGESSNSCYKAVSGIRFAIDDRNCLEIDADYLEGKVITDDVVDLVDDHTFRWIGRFDNVINSGGIKVVPEEMEAIISKSTGLDCAVVGLDDEKLGKKLVLVLEKGGSEMPPDELRSVLKDEMSLRLQPKEIVFVEELPRNHSFKVDRKKLVLQLNQ